MTALQLILPDQGTSGAASPDTDIKRLVSWLDNLPYLAVVESAEEMGGRLQVLNRNKLPASRRLKLMEHFHTAYHRLHESLIDAQLARTGRPDPHEAVQAGKILRQEMAFGYKLVVNEGLAPQYRSSGDQEIALAIERAIYYLSLYLIQHYQSYDQIDGSHWFEITVLYRYAEQQGLLEKEFSTAAQPAHATIADTFKRIALLRVSDPYRLPPGTVWDVFHYLGVHQQKIQLQAPQEGAAQAGILLLDMESNTSRESNLRDKDKYWLNGRALIKTLSIDLEKLRDGASPKEAGFSERITGAETIQLGTRLLNLWARTPQRVMPRFSGTGTTPLITGLNTIHHRLLDAQPNTDGQIGHIGCVRLNRSAGGLALQCAEQDSDGLWVGQIAAVGITDGKGIINWLPSIVRWLMRPDEDNIRFGIQYIGDKLMPVKIQTLEVNWEDRRTHAALSMELRHSGSMLQTILSPSGIFAKGRRIDLVHADQLTKVRCSQLLESLATMDRFSYSPEHT